MYEKLLDAGQKGGYIVFASTIYIIVVGHYQEDLMQINKSLGLIASLFFLFLLFLSLSKLTAAGRTLFGGTYDAHLAKYDIFYVYSGKKDVFNFVKRVIEVSILAQIGFFVLLIFWPISVYNWYYNKQNEKSEAFKKDLENDLIARQKEFESDPFIYTDSKTVHVSTKNSLFGSHSGVDLYFHTEEEARQYCIKNNIQM